VRLDSFFTGYRASHISTDLIRKFIADQQGRELSNASINRSLSALRRMFNIAKKDGKLTAAPHFPMLKEAAPRQGILEREQYETLSQCLPDYLRLPFSIAYFTAMRLDEVLGLQWSQIDFLAAEIALRAGEAKNDEGRIVPIIAELQMLLRDQFARRQPGCPWVCFRLERTGHAVKINSFRKAWYTACCSAGLGKMVATSDSKKKKIYVGTIFHDLRRSGVRNMIRAGIPEQVCMAISGHKTRSTFSRYNITPANDISDAAKKLANFHDEKKRDNSGTISTNVVQGVSLTNLLQTI
jgi:integrase